MLNPMFQQMTPQQQHMMLFQQQFATQLMAEHYFQLLHLQQSQSQAFRATAAPAVSFQNQPTNPAQNYYAQLIAQSITQQQFINQSQHNDAVTQPQYAPPGQIYNQAALPTQQSLFQQVPNMSFLNAPPPSLLLESPTSSRNTPIGSGGNLPSRRIELSRSPR